MSETAMLALAVVAIYLSECVALFPSGTVAFRRAWLKSWAVAEPWELFGGVRSVLLSGNPLPPLGHTIACKPVDGVVASLDHRTFRTRMDDLASGSQLLLVTCNILWAWLFIGLPVAALKTSLILTWPYLVGVTFILTILCAIFFSRAWGDLNLQQPSAPLQHLATIALVPTTAIRAVDILVRESVEGIHPLAAALALLQQEEFIGYARRFHFDAMQRDPAAKVLPSHWFDESRRDPIEQFLASNGAAPEALLRPPVAGDDKSKTYCPRCHTQFTVAEGTCRDCGGISLAAF